MSPATPHSAPPTPDLMAPGWRRAAAERAPVMMAIYVLAIFLLWVLPPTSLAVDETEQMIATQVWSLGYGPQLPLYTWLQVLVFEVTGPGKLGLAVLKYSLLVAIYLGMWVLARRLGLGPWGAAIAMAGMLALPTLIWSAQRDLTHTALMATLCVWAMVAAIHAIQSGRMLSYLGFGVVLAAGMLSKWNFAFLAAGMFAAALLLRQGRLTGFAASLIVMLTLLSAPAIWAINNPNIVLSSTHRFAINAGPGGAAAGAALLSLGEGVVTELLILTLLCLWAFGSFLWTARTVPPQPTERFLALSVGLTAAVSLLGVFASGTQEVNPRWLLPVTLFLPLLIALRVEPRLTQRRGTRFLSGIAGLAVVFGIAAPQAILWASPEPPSRLMPYAEAAAPLRARAPEAVFVANHIVGGSLRAVAPDVGVVPSHMFIDADLPIPEVVVWTATEPQPTPPEDLSNAFTAQTGNRIDPRRITESVVPYPGPYADHHFYLYFAEVME